MLAVQEFWGKEKNFTMEKKQNHFSGQLGFVLAAAGSAVGVGNLWRFPYLAAKDGGGLFLIIYFILVLTFGFTLLTSDIAIGRRTHKSAIGAYEQMRPKWKGLGILTFLVPVLIMTYYAVIGGWITKYAVVYVSGQASAAAADDYFTSFITSPVSPVVFALLFMGVTALIVYNGVQNGIEKVSRWMMPVLLVLVVVIACYSLTLSHTNADGQVVTGWQGFLYYLTPNLEGLTVQRFLQILLDAMSQLFFSLSVSMGIMITYGSYVHPEVDLNRAVNQIEIFDTGVAFLAGMMIIPAVYVFSGTEGMGAGPSLMFISLPKVFAAMGRAGTAVGILFFVTAIFATLSSCISVLESITANCIHEPQKDGPGAVGHLSGGVCRYRARLQCILCRGAAAERLGRPAARHHGLRQQQRHDAVHRAAVHRSDRLGDDAGLRHRRDGAQRRDLPPQKALLRHDPLCRAGDDVRAVPSVDRHPVEDRIK